MRIKEKVLCSFFVAMTYMKVLKESCKKNHFLETYHIHICALKKSKKTTSA
jgi:hypothetical protein